ncbi:hypothetical protein HELRODRAFT_160382 [Helobdella robusta]|uniref:Uncharacterized protein n=1 Tax=Helobdella robusta TaxID=6412 RepID=T1EQ65_HELRO|nr:hypothetical protein HELRODRAFT_160382 [Helobdella robusta]ESO06224.1 hypothetical protein HELRODRAFT_160382 [Helobdella robusta]
MAVLGCEFIFTQYCVQSISSLRTNSMAVLSSYETEEAFKKFSSVFCRVVKLPGSALGSIGIEFYGTCVRSLRLQGFCKSILANIIIRLLILKQSYGLVITKR